MHLFWTNKPYMNSFKSLNSRRKIGIWVILFWPDCLWHCDTPPRHAGQDSCLLFAGKCCSGCWFLLLSSLSGSDLAYRNPSQAPRPTPWHYHGPAPWSLGHKTLNTIFSLEFSMLTADEVWLMTSFMNSPTSCLGPVSRHPNIYLSLRNKWLLSTKLTRALIIFSFIPDEWAAERKSNWGEWMKRRLV